ncbi:MAG: CDP-alcohol phosphatidyltransferase family protein, partial [Thermoplasmata archaeon]|nr:CDP-alcohol phosphatidyltransferase family protein [Thermoplasmata archaeon]
MTLLRHFSPADYVTITNGAIGVLGILYFIDGGETHILTGTALILIALLMDGLDGAIARKFGSKHNIGVYLDSMSDSVSFCFAPAVFIYKMFYDIDRGSALENTDNFLAVAASISIATFGIVRLSLFSYFKEDKLETFLGLPTPSMALFVLTGGILFQNYAWFLLPATIAIGGLMLLNFPYPKIRG